jgi:tRNA(fMet)-specific endonuclease VapC
VTLSLDANVLVDLTRGQKPHLRQRWDEALASGADLRLSTIVLQELLLGAELSQHPDRQHALLERFLLGVNLEPWTAEDAEATGRLRAVFERRGERIGAYDTLIAGQALARGWIVVTANVREFIRVPSLRLLDWSDPAGAVEHQA